MLLSEEIFVKIKECDKEAFEKFVKIVAERIHHPREIEEIAREFKKQNLQILSNDIISFYINHENRDYRKYACFLAGTLTLLTKNKELYDMLEKRVSIEMDPFILADLIGFLAKSGIKSTPVILENLLLKHLQESSSPLPVSIVCEALYNINAITGNKPHVLQILISRMVQSPDDTMPIIRFIQRDITSANPVFSQIVSTLVANLASLDAGVRARSLVALAQLLGRDAAEHIKKALNDPHDEVRLAAQSALKMMDETLT